MPLSLPRALPERLPLRKTSIPPRMVTSIDSPLLMGRGCGGNGSYVPHPMEVAWDSSWLAGSFRPVGRSNFLSYPGCK